MGEDERLREAFSKDVDDTLRRKNKQISDLQARIKELEGKTIHRYFINGKEVDVEKFYEGRIKGELISQLTVIREALMDEHKSRADIIALLKKEEG